MSTNFAILKIKKIKAPKDLNNASLHGKREDSSTHFDRSRTCHNRHWTLDAPEGGPADWAKGVATVMHWQSAKARRNGPVAVEFIVTASGPFFEGDAEGAWPMFWSKATVDAWADANIAAFEKRFPGCVAAARLDMDEGTPHLHICVVPLYWKQVGDRSVQWVSFRKVFGGEKKEDAKRNMVGWQDWYAGCMAPFGLARGISKEITGAVGLTHHQYRAIQIQKDIETQSALDAALAMEARAAADAEEAMQATLRAVAALKAEREQMRAELAAARAELADREKQIAEAHSAAAAALIVAAGHEKHTAISLKSAQKYFAVARQSMVVLQRTTGELHVHAAAIKEKSRILDDYAAETDDMLAANTEFGGSGP